MEEKYEDHEYIQSCSPINSYIDNDESSDYMDFLQYTESDRTESDRTDLIELGNAIDNMDIEQIILLYHQVYPKYSDEKIMKTIASHIDYRTMLVLIDLIQILQPQDIITIYENLSSEPIEGFQGRSLRDLFKEFIKDNKDSNFIFSDEKYQILEKMLKNKEYENVKVFYQELSLIDRRKFKDKILDNYIDYNLEEIKFMFNENDIIKLIMNDSIDLSIVSQFIDKNNIRTKTKIIQIIYERSLSKEEAYKILGQCGITMESNYCETKDNEKSYEDFLDLETDIIVKAVKKKQFSYALFLLNYRHEFSNVHRDYVYKEIFRHQLELREFFSRW